MSAPDRRPARAGGKPRPPALPPLPPDSLAASLTAAAEALATVRSGSALNDGLAGLWRAHPEFDARARGAVQDMLFGTLRDYGRGECMLGVLMRQPLTEPTIDALLRICLHELEVRPDTAHTLVDQAVEAAARIARGGLKGLVNAVLRNGLRQWPQLVFECERNEQAHWRHPQWWIDALRQGHPDHWQAALISGNQHPPMSVRVNRRRSSVDEAQAALGAAGIQTRRLGEMGLLLEHAVPVARLPGFAEGLLSVQDWGAQQAARLLDLHDGQRVLDACAAPGGKTAHMLECADIDVVALDADAQRAQRVSDQLTRLGLSATVRAADCRDPAAWWDGRPFDRILVDVPCSASGVARRHPDIKWLRRSDDVANFATVQREILNALWPLLAPGGKMLYVTCSVFPQENGAQVARFVEGRPDCRRLPWADGTFEQHWLPAPDHDGFFFALLQKLG